ncbi:MAG TPA: glycoside hydrolase family 36 protein [Microlunatus sp.]
MTAPDVALRATIRQLLLAGLGELDPHQEGGWGETVDQLCGELASLPLNHVDTIKEVVESSAMLQQFLLEVVIRNRGTDVTRAEVLQTATRLLTLDGGDDTHQDPTPSVDPLQPGLVVNGLELHGLAGVRSLEPDPGTRVVVAGTGAGRAVLTVSAENGLPGFVVEVDLADAIGYWSPSGQRSRALPPEWEEAAVTSLVAGAPVGVLYNSAGETVLGWAASEAVAELSIRSGVSEERKSFVVEIRPRSPLETELQVFLDTGRDPLADAIGRLSAWMSGHVDEAPLPVPAAAREPVYSSWYTFAQDIDTDLITSESEIAAELGCGSIFIDDGWQRHGHGRGYQGCGDWLPDEAKFRDLATTVHQIRDRGAAVALWVAPLLLGVDSDAYDHLVRYAPQRVGELQCQILDPRHHEVREHLVATCLRLVTDYGVQLLKIDFLEQAMVYRGQPGRGGDVDDVGEAMRQFLQQLRDRLAAGGHGDVAFEFRQPYVSPAIARYGQILRANDCPGDSVTNRRSTLDCRLLAVGQVVHSDPMMWGLGGGAEAVAQQVYGGWFAVPQISMRLAELDDRQRTTLRWLLQLWRSQSDVTLDGRVSTRGVEHGHQLASAIRTDLDRSVIVAYAPLVVDLDHDTGGTSRTVLVNASPSTGLVVRTRRPISAGTILDVGGAQIADVGPTRAGLLELAVPAYGIATITLESP